MTPEELEERIKVIQAEEERLLGALNQAYGAELECRYWLQLMKGAAESAPSEQRCTEPQESGGSDMEVKYAAV